MDGSAATLKLPSVAVLLSTYNGAEFLQAQLESLRTQEGVLVRLYARDDGSSDDTRAILRRCGEIWPDLNEVPCGPNLGAAASFLQLLRTAPEEVDYYAFCDQDDVWLPNKLARAIEVLSGAEGPALYCSNVICVAEDLRVLGMPPAHRDHRFQHLLFENIATGCTVVLNPAARALINSRLPSRDVVMHDWWCALIVAALGRVHYDPEPSLLYRQHGGNLVGMDANWVAQKAKHALRLLQERRSFYKIYAQAAELLSLYGSQMPPCHRESLDRLAASKRSWRTRAAYAMSGEIVHRDILGSAVVRGLILAGWY
ncbi:glycosyltransferase family 2 protein [Sphingobium aromaticivastans]|uniref:glycosyltransferase family 2 protein n=1 Tax=Sphingobium aromaticivastans TaxID=1778665 RepID=UPI00301943BD